MFGNNEDMSSKRIKVSQNSSILPKKVDASISLPINASNSLPIDKLFGNIEEEISNSDEEEQIDSV